MALFGWAWSWRILETQGWHAESHGFFSSIRLGIGNWPEVNRTKECLCHDCCDRAGVPLIAFIFYILMTRNVLISWRRPGYYDDDNDDYFQFVELSPLREFEPTLLRTTKKALFLHCQ